MKKLSNILIFAVQLFFKLLKLALLIWVMYDMVTDQITQQTFIGLGILLLGELIDIRGELENNQHTMIVQIASKKSLKGVGLKKGGI